MSKELVTIKCDCDIEFDQEKFVTKSFNQEKIVELFDELGFERLKRYLNPKQAKAKNPAKNQNEEVGLFGFGQGDKSDNASQNEAKEKVTIGDVELDAAKNIDHDYQLIDTPGVLLDIFPGKVLKCRVECQLVALVVRQAGLKEWHDRRATHAGNPG